LILTLKRRELILGSMRHRSRSFRQIFMGFKISSLLPLRF
jgi:hypothetical protein